jgi:nitroimidazol reductase NimA-like FMN-containing flavoprotein (pyridoxamine 5'-phosphate oxidase superfamily)
MGFKDLTEPEIHAVLASERVIRIAFDDGAERFIVPVFYVWHEGALHGLTTPGRKSRMGVANPKVAFQIDTSARTGEFEWQSVSGEGTWEVVTDPADMAFAPLLQAKLADSPPWAVQLLMERFQALGRLAWRIHPATMSGRAHMP